MRAPMPMAKARNALRSSTDGLARVMGDPKPLEQWEVLLKDHYDGSIDWAELERNQKQLAVDAFGKAGGISKLKVKNSASRELELPQARYEASIAKRHTLPAIPDRCPLENGWEAALCRVETCQATAILSCGMALTSYSISRLYAKKPVAAGWVRRGKIKPPAMGYSFCPDQRNFLHFVRNQLPQKKHIEL
jgi:hypothetical protein